MPDKVTATYYVERRVKKAFNSKVQYHDFGSLSQITNAMMKAFLGRRPDNEKEHRVFRELMYAIAPHLREWEREELLLRILDNTSEEPTPEEDADIKQILREGLE